MNVYCREGTLFFTSNEERVLFTSDEHRYYDVWSCQKACEICIYLFGLFDLNKLCRQILGIPIGTNLASLVAESLSLLATASRLFAIAWGFTSGFSSQLFMRIFIRAYAHYFLIRRNAALLR